MAAFFLSIMMMFVLLFIATAICVALRFGNMRQEARFSEERSYQEENRSRPRRHLGGPLALSLILLFSVTLAFAVITR